MKTFEEAFSEMFPTIKASASPEEMQRFLQEGHEHVLRLKELSAEVGAHPRVRQLLVGTMAASCFQEHGLLNVFQSGLVVGMAMERSETGGIQL